jgi:hypothetical protein
MLYNPPGIGSSGSISIAADKSEAEIPLTANASAAIGTWPIVVTGRATVGNGPVEAATQMAQLEIADTFMTFTFEKATGEQGQQVELLVNVENKAEFEGEATIELLGLPANTSTDAEPKKITSGHGTGRVPGHHFEGSQAGALQVAGLPRDRDRSTANRWCTRRERANCGWTSRCRRK